jgi:hypothetical protein
MPLKFAFSLLDGLVFNITRLLVDDGQKLFRDYGILARNLVELGALARQADPSSTQAFASEDGRRRTIVSLAKVGRVVYLSGG